MLSQAGRIAATLYITALLGGCASESAHSSKTVEDAPNFSGPWAEDFAENFRLASSDLVREVLRDGVITDQENSEMTSRFRDCLAAAGVHFTDFNPDGSMEYTFDPSIGPDRADAADKRCSRKSGEMLIGSLYYGIRRNPQNLDSDVVMADCLVRKHAVPEVYSGEDFRRDSYAGNHPFVDEVAGEQAYTDCASDPLGLIFGEQDEL